MTETKYFQAVPILLIGNTAPHDVLVKRKPTRNVFKNLCDYRLCSALFCEEQLREITTLKNIFFIKYEVLLPVSQNQGWKFDFHQYFSVRKLYFEILTRDTICQENK